MDSKGHGQVPWPLVTVRHRHVAPAPRLPELSRLPAVWSWRVPLSEVERPAPGIRSGNRGAV